MSDLRAFYQKEEKNSLESSVTLRITKDLTKRDGVWFYKKHGSVMSKSGIPDLICCVWGFFVAIEVKRLKGNKPTRLQLETIDNIIKYGAGTAIVTYGFEDYKLKMDHIEEWSKEKFKCIEKYLVIPELEGGSNNE